MRLAFLLLLIATPAFATGSTDTWLHSTDPAPGGGTYWTDQQTGEYCNPNFSCYQQYVVPSLPPPVIGSGGASAPGGGLATSAQASAASVTASALVSSSGADLSQLWKAVALAVGPVLLCALGWVILKHLVRGIYLATPMGKRKQAEREAAEEKRRERRNRRHEREAEREEAKADLEALRVLDPDKAAELDALRAEEKERRRVRAADRKERRDRERAEAAHDRWAERNPRKAYAEADHWD